MLQSCFNIMFLYLYKYRKIVFSFRSLVSRKYRFWFKANFQEHKNGSNCLEYVLNFTHTYLYSKDLIRTDFCGIYVILWDLIKSKIQVSNP